MITRRDFLHRSATAMAAGMIHADRGTNGISLPRQNNSGHDTDGYRSADRRYEPPALPKARGMALLPHTAGTGGRRRQGGDLGLGDIGGVSAAQRVGQSMVSLAHSLNPLSVKCLCKRSRIRWSLT